MKLLTTLTTAFTTATLLSTAGAYEWDAAAEKWAGGDFFTQYAPDAVEGSWGKLLVDENQECYIVLNEIFNCQGRSKPFATYNAKTGYCDAFDGAEPMTAPICGGYIWFFGHDGKEKLVPPTYGHYNVSAGDLFMKSKRREVNTDPFHLGKAGCGFKAIYKDGEYQGLHEDCGLVRKPVGKWTG
ncbi:hypothetical protein N8T08_005230 [Aspergillus melleus]|uniref:Uncharacterized protein n=1 Tax=Aspergillus melleus TaxID=138277 RepID=A0ACC3BG24_9EURO|nr:hypothetical protein N8T08_005230 [Aspergillus melleus]